MRTRITLAAMALLVVGIIPPVPATSRAQDKSPADPLPSWNEGPAKTAILGFVARVTKEGGPDFVPAAERIATFDNDGTLWTEQPYYVQVAFSLDRVKTLSATHPEWRERPLFRAALDRDLKAILAGTPRDRLELIAASHAGMTPEEFDR